MDTNRSRPLRVCILQRYLPPDPSGAGKQAITLGKALQERGHDVFLMGDSSSDSSSPPESVEGVPIVRVDPVDPDPNRRQIIRYWFRLIVAVVRYRKYFDVLQLHAMSFLHSAVIPVARLLQKPVVVRSSLEGEVPDPGRSRSDWLHFQFLRFANRFVVISQRLQREYVRGGIPENKIERIPNGVDTSRYSPVSASEKRTLRRKLDLPTDRTLLTYHGVFVARKSLHWVLPLLEDYLVDTDLVLLLIGSPGRDEEQTQYYSRLRHLISQSSARDSIVTESFKDEVSPYLQASDLYILPSTGEGLPNALLEAMAVGLIPLASRTSGTEEVIEDGKSGFLFEPRDASSFESALRRAMEANGTARGHDVSAAAVRRISSTCSISTVAQRYGEIYEHAARPSEDTSNRLPGHEF